MTLLDCFLSWLHGFLILNAGIVNLEHYARQFSTILFASVLLFSLSEDTERWTKDQSCSSACSHCFHRCECASKPWRTETSELWVYENVDLLCKWTLVQIAYSVYIYRLSSQQKTGSQPKREQQQQWILKKKKTGKITVKKIIDWSKCCSFWELQSWMNSVFIAFSFFNVILLATGIGV